MPRHSLARAKSSWKSAKVTMGALLAVVVTIPAVHVGAAILHNVPFSNYSKSRRSDVDASPARARRTHMPFVTQNERNLSRHQWGAEGDLASSVWPSPSPSGSREPSSKDRQRSAASHRTYRTVCVRLCDGYFFPISFAVLHQYLVRDARRCEEGCGGEARLFYHSDVNADIADMKDLEGRPYSKLERAFLYRTAYFPNCKCQPHPWENEATEPPPYVCAGSRQQWRHGGSGGTSTNDPPATHRPTNKG
jgi:uncharacterized protein DUF2865